MNILFEEDGVFRAGVVLADNNTSLQAELPGGKRTKVKAANVLLRFAAPSPAELLARAAAAAEEIDAAFLWEVSPDDEFGFDALAADYFGARPEPAQAAAVLMRLHSAPIHFHRKGKGRYRKAPPDILAAALAGLEKKRQAQLAVERMTAQLVAGELPAEFAGIIDPLLYAPDRNRSETKALEAACAATRHTVVQVLQACGALPSSHELHFNRFLYAWFPRSRGGTDFPPYDMPAAVDDLPLADVAAFSIDDAATTEIDDAFSVARDGSGYWRVGIHIAAPGLAIAPESDLGRIARNRLSTVYMPGRKITMLPPAIIEHFTLAAGRPVPAISLYLDIAPDLRIVGRETRIERVPVVANLRHHDIEPLFNAETLADGLPDFAFRDELRLLWELATVLEAGRTDPARRPATAARREYSFEVDWDARAEALPGEPGVVHIALRPRGSPLDLLVAELMIVVNAGWGAQLRDAGIPALYRAQSAGKVRMTTVAAPHEGLGVDCYAWSSSPLRRYCDLLNQWQLIACLRGEPPPFAPRSAELLAAMRDFDATYAAYAEFQRGMERYWCLRALVQDGRREIDARIIREQLVRCEDWPLVIRMLDLPAAQVAAPGRRVRIAIESIDLFAADLRTRFVTVLPDGGGEADDDLADDDALTEMPLDSGSDAAIGDGEATQPAE